MLCSCGGEGSSSLPDTPSVPDIPSIGDDEQLDYAAYPFSINTYFDTSSVSLTIAKTHVAKLVLKNLNDTSKSLYILSPKANNNGTVAVDIWYANANKWGSNNRLAHLVLNSYEGDTSSLHLQMDKLNESYLWDIAKDYYIPTEGYIYNYSNDNLLTSSTYCTFNGDTFYFRNYLSAALNDIINYYSLL